MCRKEKRRALTTINIHKENKLHTIYISILMTYRQNEKKEEDRLQKRKTNKDNSFDLNGLFEFDVQQIRMRREKKKKREKTYQAVRIMRKKEKERKIHC